MVGLEDIIAAAKALKKAVEYGQQVWEVYGNLKKLDEGEVLRLFNLGTEKVYIYPDLVKSFRGLVDPVEETARKLEEYGNMNGLGLEPLDDSHLELLRTALEVCQKAISDQSVDKATTGTLDKIKVAFKNRDKAAIATKFKDAAEKLARALSIVQGDLVARIYFQVYLVRAEVTAGRHELQQSLQTMLAKLEALISDVTAEIKEANKKVLAGNDAIAKHLGIPVRSGSLPQILEQDLGRDEALKQLIRQIGDRRVYYMTGFGRKVGMIEEEVKYWVDLAWKRIKDDCGSERYHVDNKVVLLYGGDPYYPDEPDVAAVAHGLQKRSNGQLEVMALQALHYRPDMIRDEATPKYNILSLAYFHADPNPAKPGTYILAGYNHPVLDPRGATARVLDLRNAKAADGQPAVKFGCVFFFGGGRITADELHCMWERSVPLVQYPVRPRVNLSESKDSKDIEELDRAVACLGKLLDELYNHKDVPAVSREKVGEEGAANTLAQLLSKKPSKPDCSQIFVERRPAK